MSRRVEHPRVEAERRVAPWRRRKNEANNNKFAFLKPGDPFNPYYAEQVVANGGKPPAGAADAAASAKISGESTVKPVKKAAAGVMPLEPPGTYDGHEKPVTPTREPIVVSRERSVKVATTKIAIAVAGWLRREVPSTTQASFAFQTQTPSNSFP